jgi:hypothetical protein
MTKALVFVTVTAFTISIFGHVAAAQTFGGGVSNPNASVGHNAPGPPSQPLEEKVEIQQLNLRIAALEASRQDLSAWATILIGIVTLLVLTNVGLSIWQVGSLARKEVDEVIAQYDKQFSGFLTRGESTIAEKLEQYGEMISDLSGRMNDIAVSVQQYAITASTAMAAMQREASQAIVKLQAEGERLRADLGRIRAAAKDELDTQS